MRWEWEKGGGSSLFFPSPFQFSSSSFECMWADWADCQHGLWPLRIVVRERDREQAREGAICKWKKGCKEQGRHIYYLLKVRKQKHNRVFLYASASYMHGVSSSL